MSPQPRQLVLPFAARAPAPGRPGGVALERRGGVELVEMTCRSILNWVQGSRASDFYSINPYRGCEHACAYCYARYTHEFLDQPGSADFERRVYVKVNAPEVLVHDLRHAKVYEHGISFGSATDPYQPAEHRFRLTRRLLEGLLPFRGFSLSIVTKSALVERDVELLAELASRHELAVLFSCMTTDPVLQRALEPRASAPERRLQAMARLSAAGVHTELLVAPLMPGLNDGEEALGRLCRRAREAGAVSVFGQALFLFEASRRRFFSWLEQHRPELTEPYRRAFARSRELDREVRDELSDRLTRAAAAAGLGAGRRTVR
ncbi:MAG TPA: radical SAM protein [Myxococcales bacterium]|nr:radical SAM protein [Myxococcales bacterium]